MPDGPKLKDGWQAELKVPEGPNGAPEGPNGVPEGPKRARGARKSLTGEKESLKGQKKPQGSILSGLSAYLKQGLPKFIRPINA